MKSIEFSEKELEVVILGLKEREERMFRDAQEYKKQDNKPAQFDCIHEMHTVQHLRERLERITKK
jgi:heterodisulfide reductase subunit B